MESQKIVPIKALIDPYWSASCVAGICFKCIRAHSVSQNAANKNIYQISYIIICFVFFLSYPIHIFSYLLIYN